MTDGIQSGMVEVKCGDLVGPALDWAVAHATKIWEWAHEWFPTMTLDPTFRGVSDNAPCGHVRIIARNPMRQESQDFCPSTDWAQGGRLIEREQIELEWDGVDGKALWWKATHQDIAQFQMGETPLIAACRAIVAAHLGEVVSVPTELTQPK